MLPPPPDLHISLVIGVTIGLVASFVQSLGLTLQRASHVANEALPISHRKPDRQRPLWLVGFAMFIATNSTGTIFTIGVLPLTLLAAMGGVSLLWTALLSCVILRDVLTVHLAAGIVLVVTGAVLIGMFGAVPEPTHTLNELIALYRRPAFIVWISLLILAVLIVIALAHLAEWNLERHTTRLSSPHPVTTLYGTNGFSRSTATVPLISDQEPSLAPPTSGRGPASHREQHDVHDRGRNPLFSSSIILEDEATSQAARSLSNERTRLVLGIAYAAVAGALSGLCLLFTKTSLELLILTLGGKNQFGRIEAWIILLTLVVAEFTQLFHLNRAVRLVGPTLVSPVAFCFYSITSIISGLIYYNEWDQLSQLQAYLVGLGTAILLGGVWIISRNDRDQSILVPPPSHQPDERRPLIDPGASV